MLFPSSRDAPQSANTSQNTSTRGSNCSVGHLSSSVGHLSSSVGHLSSSASFSAEKSLRNEGSFRVPVRADTTRAASGGRLQVPIARDGGSAETSTLSSSTHVSADSSLDSTTSLRGPGRNTSRCGWVGMTYILQSPRTRSQHVQMWLGRHDLYITVSGDPVATRPDVAG